MTCSATSLRDAEEWNLDFSSFSITVLHRVQLCTYIGLLTCLTNLVSD